MRIFTVSITIRKKVEQITFYLMLRCIEIIDDTYESYKSSVEEYIADLETRVKALEGIQGD